MKKPLSIPILVLAAVAVVAVGWFAYAQVSDDHVVTGTKTGYSRDSLPPPPSFKIPPPPSGAPGGVSAPPPAGTRPGNH